MLLISGAQAEFDLGLFVFCVIMTGTIRRDYLASFEGETGELADPLSM